MGLKKIQEAKSVLKSNVEVLREVNKQKQQQLISILSQFELNIKQTNELTAVVFHFDTVDIFLKKLE